MYTGLYIRLSVSPIWAWCKTGLGKFFSKRFAKFCSTSPKGCVGLRNWPAVSGLTNLSVNAWLRKWDTVLAFVSARQVDGGTGAVYVLLQDA